MENYSCEISVIIPVYNEEENVPLLVEQIHKGLTGKSYEILLTDDGSTDETVKRIKELNDDKLTLIELKKNYGQSLALAAGIDQAVGEYIVTLDGDLQNDPSDILQMLELLKKEDQDVVTGIRQKRKDNIIRTFPSKIANWLIMKTTGLKLKDHGCALKVFKAETAKELNLYGEMHRYINLLAYLNGARITQVPVKHHARKFGVSKYGLGRTTKVMNDLLLLLFLRKYFQRPIHLFGNMGLASFSFGSLILLYLMVVKFIFGEDIGNRPMLTFGILLLIVGIQFFTTGIIIDLLMKTYYEAQNLRPYRIRSIYRAQS